MKEKTRLQRGKKIRSRKEKVKVVKTSENNKSEKRIHRKDISVRHKVGHREINQTTNTVKVKKESMDRILMYKMKGK